MPYVLKVSLLIGLATAAVIVCTVTGWRESPEREARMKAAFRDPLLFQQECGAAPYVRNEQVRGGVPRGMMTLAYPSAGVMVMFAKRHPAPDLFKFDEISFFAMDEPGKVLDSRSALTALGCRDAP